MSVPVIQQSVSGLGTTAFAATAFSNPAGAGNGLLVAINVQVTSGTISALGATDNNNNTYSQVLFSTHKTQAYIILACTNLKNTPNATISITPTGTFSGGAGVLSRWRLGAGEWNNCDASNIVLASNSAGTIANASPSNVVLAGQPAGTTAVGFDDVFTIQSHLSGPPTWTLQQAGGGATSFCATFADSENFAAGTVTFKDTGNGATPSYFGLVILKASSIPPGAPWFLQQEQIENSFKRKH